MALKRPTTCPSRQNSHHCEAAPRHSFRRRGICKALPLERLEKFNVEVHVNSKVVEITDRGVIAEKGRRKDYPRWL